MGSRSIFGSCSSETDKFLDKSSKSFNLKQTSSLCCKHDKIPAVLTGVRLATSRILLMKFNSEIMFSYLLEKTYIVTPHRN